MLPWTFLEVGQGTKKGPVAGIGAPAAGPLDTRRSGGAARSGSWGTHISLVSIHNLYTSVQYIFGHPAGEGSAAVLMEGVTRDEKRSSRALGGSCQTCLHWDEPGEESQQARDKPRRLSCVAACLWRGSGGRAETRRMDYWPWEKGAGAGGNGATDERRMKHGLGIRGRERRGLLEQEAAEESEGKKSRQTRDKPRRLFGWGSLDEGKQEGSRALREGTLNATISLDAFWDRVSDGATTAFDCRRQMAPR